MNNIEENKCFINWAAALASLAFSCTAIYVVIIYGTVQFEIIGMPHTVEEALAKEKLNALAKVLDFHWVFAALAFLFGIWSLVLKPKWPSIVCTFIAIIAIYSSITVV